RKNRENLLLAPCRGPVYDRWHKPAPREPALNSLSTIPPGQEQTMLRRPAIASAFVLALTGWLTLCATAHSAGPRGDTRDVRFQSGNTVSYGLVDGDKIKQLAGDLFDNPKPTGTVFARKDVKILAPTKPTQILAMAGNYKSHLGDKEQDPRFLIPQAFFKSPS